MDVQCRIGVQVVGQVGVQLDVLDDFPPIKSACRLHVDLGVIHEVDVLFAHRSGLLEHLLEGELHGLADQGELVVVAVRQPVEQVAQP